jgi:cytosine deaminase
MGPETANHQERRQGAGRWSIFWCATPSRGARTASAISRSPTGGSCAPAARRGAIDAGGRLVVPGFVEPHIHLDKAFIREECRVNQSGTLMEAIEIIWDKKRRYTVEEVAARAGRVIESAAAHGVTRMRTHVDVDNIGGLVPLHGVVRAREQCRDLVDLQIIAFPQEGIFKNDGTARLMREAMEQGADIVGGMPFNEPSPDDSRRHIDLAFALATEFDADIDMHVDETDDPSARTLEMLADATMREGWEGRVTAGHTCALAGYPDDYAGQVIAKVKQAGIHMICNPATNLVVQGRLDRQPVRRGITRVRELLAAGINVSYGQDCVDDPFYPFGRVDPLEVALIMAHAAHLTKPNEIETVFSMQNFHAAKVLRLDDYGFEQGALGDLVVLDAFDAAQAIRERADRMVVVKRGRVVAETTTTRQVHRQAS